MTVYTGMNKPGGASTETWEQIRSAFPELNGLDDAALAAAFAEGKREGAGNRAIKTVESDSAFVPLKPPEKVALVRAVRGGTYAAKMEEYAGVPADAWASIIEGSPDLAGLSIDTLEAATAELLAMNDGAPPPSASSSGGAAAVAVPIAVALIAIAVSFSAVPPSDKPTDGFDANAQVQRNLKKWAAKNLPSSD